MMLPAKSLRGIALTIKSTPRARRVISNDRRLASTITRKLPKSSRSCYAFDRSHLTCSSGRQVARPILSSATLRFASTVPKSPEVQTFPSPIDPPSGAEPVSTINNDVVSPSLDELISNVPAAIPEKLGYLKDIGLDYGWGPTAFVEWVLEHIHVFSGTPWWGSIVLTALAMRLAIFRLYIDAADTSARVATMSDVIKPLQARMKTARENEDQSEYLACTEHLKSIYQKSGIKMWKLFVPFIQVPIGYGTIRLLRGMAELPVPGAHEGGFLWVQDLTVSDPYYILPAVMALSIHATIRGGTELGTASVASPGMQKFSLYVMPLLGGGFILWQPAMVQVAFCFTALLSYAQATFFRNPSIRARLGIHPLPKPKSDANTATSSTNYLAPAPKQGAEQPKGLVASLKGSFSSLVSTARAQATQIKGPTSQGPTKKKHGRTAKELEEAQRYEERYQRQSAASKKKTVR